MAAEVSAMDRAAITDALRWLLAKRGEFDLVALTDIPPTPVEWRLSQKESPSPISVPESALAQLSRRNSDPLSFRYLDLLHQRVLSLTHRTADVVPDVSEYFVVLRRGAEGWSVIWSYVRESVIVT